MPKPLMRMTKAVELYRKAEREVRAAGFAWEIDWQRSRDFGTFSEPDLLRETAWVILCTGFRESVVRKRFDYISLCFCDWESAQEISHNRAVCIDTASIVFRNKRKLDAIAGVAEIICERGFLELREQIQQQPIDCLQTFPFIGPITSWHLAKNLGMNIAKNDRHLARTAVCCGYTDAHTLCNAVSACTGDPSSVVDIVLWRYAVMSR